MVFFKKRGVVNRRRFTRSTIRPYAKRKTVTGRPTLAKLNYKLRTLSKQVWRQRPETMHITTNHNGNFALLNGIGIDGYYSSQVAYPSQGDDQYQRHGRDLRVTAIAWQGILDLPVAYPDDAYVLLMIVQDMKVGDGAFTPFRISSLFNKDSKNRYSPHCLRNTDFWKDFRIIATKRILMKRVDTTIPSRRPFKIVRRVNNLVSFQGSGNLPTSPPYYLLALCDTGDVSAGAGIDIFSQVRLMYYDS